MKPDEETIVDGNDITCVRTLKTMYDMDSVAVWVGDPTGDNSIEYRIKADVLCACISEFKFKAVPAKKYTYLEIDQYPPLEGVNYESKKE